MPDRAVEAARDDIERVIRWANKLLPMLEDLHFLAFEKAATEPSGRGSRNAWYLDEEGQSFLTKDVDEESGKRIRRTFKRVWHEETKEWHRAAIDLTRSATRISDAFKAGASANFSLRGTTIRASEFAVAQSARERRTERGDYNSALLEYEQQAKHPGHKGVKAEERCAEKAMKVLAKRHLGEYNRIVEAERKTAGLPKLEELPEIPA